MKKSTLIAFSFLFLFASFCGLQIKAATLYWVGGSGEWHNSSHWAVTSGGNGGVKVPNSTDDIVFDLNSFASPNENIVFSGSMECHSMTWTSDVKNPIVSGGPNSSLEIFGSFLLASPLHWNYTGEIDLKSSQNSNIINSFGKILPGNIIINGSGSWQMSGSLLLSPTSTLTYISGALTTNGNAIQCGVLNIEGSDYKIFDFSQSIIAIKNTFSDAGASNFHTKANNAKIYFQNYLPLTNLESIHVHNSNAPLHPSVISVDSVIINPTCNGADTGLSCNGAIIIRKINANDGGPFSISWAGPKPGIDTITVDSVFNLCPNTYSFTIIDSADNTVYGPIFVTITAPPPFTVNYTKRQAKCFGLCDGWISTRISGETPNYTYRWSNGITGTAIGSPSNPFIDTGLCAGTYSIRIKDSNGCLNTFKTTIKQPLPVTITFVTTNVTCNGSCNGSAAATVTGGHGQYTYTWSPGGQTTATISALCAGTYSLTAVDDSGCVGIGTVTITQPTPLTISITKSNITCNGNCNGIATAIVSGGTPAYTYKWSNGATTSSISGLCSGVFKIVVTDKNGCKDSANVTISQPATITINVSQTNVSCNGNCNGTATITVSGGTPAYTYKWSTGATTSSISSLCAGVYKILVTDSNHCKDSLNVTITQPTAIAITITQTNPTCNGNCNGTAIASVTGGTPAYTYKWSTGATTSSISGLCAGVYKFVVTDKNGCKDSVNVTITQPAGMTLTTSNTSVTCNGNCIGTASVTVTGGTSPYTYKWSTGATTTSISNLCAGVYKIVVTDNKGCKDSANVTITQPNPLILTITQKNVKCKGDCNGSATATVSGGTPTYTYKWSTGATTSSISGLCAGAYKIVVIDANGCKDSVIVTITQPAVSLTLTTSQTNVKCNGNCDGTATATVTGGAPVYTYSWSTGATTSSISGLCPGVYKILVTDANGCKDSANVTITQPTPLSISTTQTNVNCSGNCIGTATATASGGTPAYTYKWSTGATTTTISGLCAGVYKIVVTDANGCKDSANVTITQPAPLILTVTQTNVKCKGDCNGSATATVTGGSPAYTYKWSTGATTSSISALCAGVYKIVVTEKNGCKDSANVTITQPATSLTITTSQTNVNCNGNCNGIASVTVTGGAPVYTYNWSNGGTTSSISNLCPGVYKIVVKDANGCKDSANVTITQPTPLSISTTQTNVNCSGNCIGTATATVSGGTLVYTYKWSNGATTSSIIGLCAGVYKLVVTDNNGCKDSVNVNITSPTPITLTIVQTNVKCKGDCNGTATVTASGGSTPYTYKWSNGATTSSISGLCAGVYKIVVTDNKDCKDSVNVNITQPANGLTINTSQTNISCNGNCNGTITATVTGGTPIYTYKWSNGATTASISGLCAGNFKLVVTDSNGCKDSITIAITQPSPLILTTTQTNVPCNGNCNGTASVTVSGGSPAYTYKWNTGATTTSVSGLCPGTSRIVVTDANGCKDSVDIFITQPTALTITTTQSNINCKGNCNGTASVTASGGSPAYTYKWSTGATTTSVSGLCSGIYKIVVTDSHGCKDSVDITITQPASALSINLSQTNIACNGSCNGSVVATVSGGTPAYTYKWSNGGTISSISNLCAGNYTLVVTDANGCKDSVIAIITQPTPLTIIASQTNISCNGNCNGTISATISGGTPGYSYKWSTGATTTTISGLCAGNYKLVVTDKNGCKDSVSINITQPNAINISMSQTNVTCLGNCNGTASATVTGGIPTYTYKWNTGSTISNISGLCAGNYTLVVADASGCKDSAIVSITQPTSALTLSTSNTNVLCNGNCNGAATVNASGGTPAYTYKWSNGQTTATANTLCAGNYTIVVTDAGGCSETAIVTITQPSAIRDSITSITNISCNSSNDGGATIGVKGGTAPYTYSWTPSGGNSSTATNLTAGNYTVTITDGNGCQSTLRVTISQPQPISISITQTNLTCSGNCNGTATANASGGTLPYTYTWSVSQTTQTVTGLCAASYTVVILDNTGCSSSATFTITSPAPLIATIISNKISCHNSCDGVAIENVYGGTAPYTYTVSNGSSNLTYYNDTLSNLCPGITYTITITDSNKCTYIDSIRFTNPAAIAETNTVSGSSCSSMNDGSISLSVSGGTPSYTFLWSNGATTQNQNNILSGTYTVTIKDSAGCTLTDTIIVPTNKTVVAVASRDTSVCAGNPITLIGTASINAVTYKWLQLPGFNDISDTSFVTVTPKITTTYILIVSNGGCTDTTSVTITINASIAVDAGPTQYITPNQTVTIGGSPTGPNGSTYLWEPGYGLSDSTVANPVASPSVTTTYTVYVDNPNGCPGSDTVTVFVVPQIVIPDGFSPNGDGQNDAWIIGFVNGFPGVVVEVYNRWGELLFRSVGYKNPWDGTYMGKPVPVGTYYYVINLHDPRFTQTYTGPVTVLR